MEKLLSELLKYFLIAIYLITTIPVLCYVLFIFKSKNKTLIEVKNIISNFKEFSVSVK